MNKGQDALRRRIKAKLDQLVDQLFEAPNPPQTLDEIEEAALALREKAGRIVAQEIAKQQANNEVSSKNLACSCGGFARDKGRRKRQVVALAGNLAFQRHYFYCRRCDAGCAPLDARLGLGESTFTRRVIQEVARLSSVLPFAPAMGLFLDLCGVSVSAKEAQRLSLQAGQVAQAYLAEREQATRSQEYVCALAPEVLYLEADGVHTPMKREAESEPGRSWREMKVGLARALKKNGVAAGPNRYISHLGDSDTFAESWSALAIEAGALSARRVVALGDGSPWIWNQVSLHFPWAVQILDFFHASEYLWEVGRAAFGEAAVAREWVGLRQEEMLASQRETLWENLRRVAWEHPGASEAVEKTLGYFENNRERMDYARYVALGLSIGSGAAESACKRVVSQRLKGAGMGWCERGAQTIARLRCLLLSEEWGRFVGAWNRMAAPAPAMATV